MPPAELLLEAPLELLPPCYFSSEKSWIALGEAALADRHVRHSHGDCWRGLMGKRLLAVHVTHGRVMGTFSFLIIGLSLLALLNVY